MSQPTSKFWPGFDNMFKSGGFLKANPEVNPLSACSVMLEMWREDECLGKGTGWFWRHPDGIALVTAWHNFAGLHHTTREPMDQRGMPDRIRYRYMTHNPRTFQDEEIPLYLDEERTSPRWFVHSVCGSYLDMAFLLLKIEGADVLCVNDVVSVATTPIRPTHDVFAIGFAQGVSMFNVFPIWKRGTIASDPDFPVEGHPKFYVDMPGRGGLSGAPAYRLVRGLVSEESDDLQSIAIGEKFEFLGLYSGRAADQLPPQKRTGESTDLGFLWRTDFILEMLGSAVLDECPEWKKGGVTLTSIWHKPGEENDSP